MMGQIENLLGCWSMSFVHHTDQSFRTNLTERIAKFKQNIGVGTVLWLIARRYGHECQIGNHSV
ncbi:hypothetical protein Enr13x_37690 [Stieleria neptunia]|uniref:Uncharacterized protein n=1 Tax=Stieleria neptunia TaxID=2527979 RepID=A0A518HST1_9BACT|nr:hypothetical protein Enr13x_37690 [Stieleria neptunia]